MRWLLFLTCALALGGCVIAPEGAKDESARLDAAGAPYATGRSQRVLPELPSNPDWRDVLHRAFLASGDLEAAYHEWAMAVARIDQAGSYPSQPLEIGFEYMFSPEQMKAFDRTTVMVGLMDSTAWPTKTYQSAKVAWRDAQAAGERFRQAKFELQQRVLDAWTDYALTAERLRIQQENLSLLQLLSDTAGSRVRAGSAQQEQLRADVDLRVARSELQTLQSELRQRQAMLNALLLRPADAPLAPPATFPTPRPLTTDDATLLAVGIHGNAELSAMNFEQTGRDDALELARMAYLPEFNPSAGFTGSLSQFLGASIVLPTELPKIRGMIREAQADLRRVQAEADQKRADRAASFVAALLALRDAERRATLFEKEILPLAQRTLDLNRQAYASGNVLFTDLIATQRTLLEMRLLIAEARATRERRLAELEQLAGADVETLPITQPTTRKVLP